MPRPAVLCADCGRTVPYGTDYCEPRCSESTRFARYICGACMVSIGPSSRAARESFSSSAERRAVWTCRCWNHWDDRPVDVGTPPPAPSTDEVVIVLSMAIARAPSIDKELGRMELRLWLTRAIQGLSRPASLPSISLAAIGVPRDFRKRRQLSAMARRDRAIID